MTAPKFDDPITRVEWKPARSLTANDYNPNRVFTPELILLERSILSLGWVQPILANPDGIIIDGFHRWRLAQDSKAIATRYNRKVPVCVLDVDEPTAMAITVRINRAKGSHSSISMAALAHRIVNDHGWTRERLAEEIGATGDEVTLLLQDGIFAARKIEEWAYSPRWYPVALDSDAGREALDQDRNAGLKDTLAKQADADLVAVDAAASTDGHEIDVD